VVLTRSSPCWRQAQFGHELVQGWHAAAEPGQVQPEPPESSVGAVDELVQCARRTRYGVPRMMSLWVITAPGRPRKLAQTPLADPDGYHSSPSPPCWKLAAADRAEPIGSVADGKVLATVAYRGEARPVPFTLLQRWLA
jgi:hypothetical protein